MASSISAGTTSATALVHTADTSGALELKTNNGTVAVTIDTSQRTAFVAGTAALPAITTTGDTNTGIFFPAADTIAFSEGGAEAMRIDSSGNVGIGTSSPSGRLHVESSSGGLPLYVNTTASAQNARIRLNSTDNASSVSYVLSYSHASLNKQAAMLLGGTGSIGFYVNQTAGAEPTTGTLAATFDSAGNVGIGTSSPTTFSGSLVVYAASNPISVIASGSANAYLRLYSTSDNNMYLANLGGSMAMLTANTERMRIDSVGNVLVGKTTTATTTLGWSFGSGTGNAKFSTGNYMIFNRDNDDILINFRRSDSSVGTITVNSTNTAYNTSSDYRLKEDIAPMTGALAKVAALKPCTYKWKVDGSDGEGFIAHELQEVVPHCVTGEKDAVDAGGNPQYQGIDVSFLVATLTAAIQEQQALITSLTARIAALEGTPA